SLRDVRTVAYADAAFSNYMLLEGQAIIRTLDANLADGVPNVELAESAVRYAAEILPLVENVSLDTVWLGLRVRGTGEDQGADRASDVRLRVTEIEGPGDLVAYVTETFGTPPLLRQLRRRDRRHRRGAAAAGCPHAHELGLHPAGCLHPDGRRGSARRRGHHGP